MVDSMSSIKHLSTQFIELHGRGNHSHQRKLAFTEAVTILQSFLSIPSAAVENNVQAPLCGINPVEHLLLDSVTSKKLMVNNLIFDQTVPGYGLHLGSAKRNVFLHSDYAEIKNTDVKSSRDGSIKQLHISLFVSKFSPIQRGLDGLCGIVHEVRDSMYLQNHPGVPPKLQHLKYFVAGFGSRVIPGDSTSQRSIEIFGFRSYGDAHRKALRLRKIPTTVHFVRRNSYSLGVVKWRKKKHCSRNMGRNKPFYVRYNVLPKLDLSHKLTKGKIHEKGFDTFEEAQQFSNSLWELKNPRILPFTNPSKETIISALRLSSKQRTEKFFSILRNITYLAIGTKSKPRTQRIARIHLDKMFKNEQEARHHASNHRPKRHPIITTVPLPSKLIRLNRSPVNHKIDAGRFLFAFGALLPDDPHRTHNAARHLMNCRKKWVEKQKGYLLEKWQIDALLYRLHPSVGKFSRGIKLWNRSKKLMGNTAVELDKIEGMSAT